VLVLTRKCGEAIVLPGYDVTVSVIKVAGRRVKLGVSAPNRVAIRREELLKRTRDHTGRAESSTGRA
jgi:carbon storage regulator